MKSQKQTVLNYRVILKSDNQTGSNKPCYVAHCPTLGVVDDGDDTKEALKNIKETIKFHLKSLQQEHKEIPVDYPNEEMIVNTQISFPRNTFAQFAV